MSADDRAIVVGVTFYPGLPYALRGPENDARAFREWLIAPGGGNVPADNVRLILSSDYPLVDRAEFARPTAQDVERRFDEIETTATANQDGGAGRRVGRRLYLYFAGHGFAPDLREVALLMANATPIRSGHHVLGTAWAHLFLDDGYFEEVILFMDCCREIDPARPLNWPRWARLRVARGPGPPRYFFAFATSPEGAAREYEQQDGTVRGAFTVALLEGLNGAGLGQDGRLTAWSLANYVDQRLPGLFPEGRRPVATGQPQYAFDGRPEDFVLSQSPAGGLHYTVRVPVPAGVRGEVEVLDGRLQPFRRVTVSGPELVLDLPRGLWLVRAPGWQERVTAGAP